jgi:hypothetical protein
MKNSILLYIILIFSSLPGFSQRIYPASQTELIFSLAHMNSTAVHSSQVVRFSGFLNHEFQLHVNLRKHFGYYSAIGIKNIGMINRFGDQDINLKQRSYAVSFPLAFKFGNIQNQSFLAFGAEINLLLNYKEKFLYGDTKTKKSEWFSNKVNPFQPAVFFQIKYLKNQIITFKYFLNDYLRYQPGGLKLPDGTVVSDYGRSSNIFYISWGSSLEAKSPETKKTEPKKIRTARLEEY